MEGIYICAAPHCLKSFLKKADFEAHIHETHADLLGLNEKDGGSENNAQNTSKPSSTDAQKQSLQPEVSTARAPPKPGLSPSSNSQQQEREERNRRHQSRDPPPRPPLQPKLSPFQNRQQPQSGDLPAENPPHGFDRPYNWFPQLPTGPPPYQQNPDQFSAEKSSVVPFDASFPNFPPLPHQQFNYPVNTNPNQALAPTAQFPFAPFPTDGSQPYYAVHSEMPRPDSAVESGSEQLAAQGNQPPPQQAIGSFPDNMSRQWAMGFMAVPFQQLQMGQGMPEGIGTPMDHQAGVAFFPGDFGRMPESMMNPPPPGKGSEQQGGLAADRNDGRGLMAMQPPSLVPPMLLPPPLPTAPPPMAQQQQQQLNRSADAPPGFGWMNDERHPNSMS